MQSYLGHYNTAASNREQKIVRAIYSVLNQSFKDWELIVIADGCEKTFDLVCEKYSEYKNIDCRLISKQTMWGGGPRNYGLSIANGEWAVYLDNDDYFGPDHLKTIADNISSFDWVWFNDLVKTADNHVERSCIIDIKNQFGTSNVAHKISLGAKWCSYGYGSDDYGLVAHLKQLSSNYGKIATPQYFVCHIPKKVDL
jgi:glycosyltransferase involved in cell wall biosynthesis